MFVNKLIDFHKSKLSQHNLIYKYIKGYSMLFLFSVIISSIAIVWLLLVGNFYYIVIPVFIYLLSIYLFSKCIKKTIFNKYNVKINSVRGWAGWTDYKVKLLRIYIRQNNCFDKNKIQNYIEFLEKEAIKRKPSNYLLLGVPGMLIALFIPPWNNFNNWIFTHLITSLEVGIVYIIITLIVLFLISFLLGMIKMLASDFLESDYRKINDLVYLLELVAVSFEEPIIDETILQKIS